MIVHGGRPSPFVRKVLTVLEEKGIAHEQKDLTPMPKTPELLAMHPLGKIPILEHDGAYIPDSSVICAYLQRLHPEPSVYPKDAKQFARALFIEEYCDSKLAESVGPIFFERFVKKFVFQQEPDEAVIQNARDNLLPPLFDWLEGQVGDGDTILGEFSIADVALAGQLGSLRLVEEPIDAGRWPKLVAYADKLFARPSVKAAYDG